MQRTFWLKEPGEREKFRQFYGTQLMSMVFDKQEIWLASPWVTDFDLLDNRTGNWSSLEPTWGCRFVRHSEVLVKLMASGSRLHLVTTSNEPYTKRFVDNLESRISDSNVLRVQFMDKSHIFNHVKGFLTKNFLIEGSMNFTRTGFYESIEKNYVKIDKSTIVDQRLNFRDAYGEFMGE